MTGLIKWHDKRIVIEGEGIHLMGTMDITATLFDLNGEKPEWQLVWRFFTSQQLLLSSGFEGGMESQKQVVAEAERIFAREIAKSETIKQIRESHGWRSLH